MPLLSLDPRMERHTSWSMIKNSKGTRSPPPLGHRPKFKREDLVRQADINVTFL